MYHYVRELANSQYPEIKGLEVAAFREQILYLKKFYNFITMEQLVDSIESDYQLPDKAVLLTFDDGYVDHYTCVFPILVENLIQGSFFIPAQPVMEHTVLDVNKIHFVLASCTDKHLIVEDIFLLLDKYRERFNLKSNEYYYSKLAISNRFDMPEVIFIKRLLQVELEENLRQIVIDALFKKYIGVAERTFSKELYMSMEQIKAMRTFGMHIGSHGFCHYWFNSLSREKQESEILKSIEFLNIVGADRKYLTMCYPYGASNNDTVEILNEREFKLAFTTNVNVADIKIEGRYCLSRLDTNDLPKRQNQDNEDWFVKG